MLPHGDSVREFHNRAVYRHVDYTQAGLPSKKRLQWNYHGKTLNLGAGYAFDTEGQVTSVSYPTTRTSATRFSSGPIYNYSFDSMNRPTGLTDQVKMETDVTGVQYGPAGELKAITYFGNYEARAYFHEIDHCFHLKAISDLKVGDRCRSEATLAFSIVD